MADFAVHLTAEIILVVTVLRLDNYKLTLPSPLLLSVPLL